MPKQTKPNLRDAHGVFVVELVKVAREVKRAWLKWGPVDDGRPEGTRFDKALTNMLGAVAYFEKRYRI